MKTFVGMRAATALGLALCLAAPLAAYAAPQTTGIQAGQTASAQVVGQKASPETTASAQTTAPGTAANDVAAGTPSEELLAWANGMECATCHTTEAASADESDAPMATHAPLGPDCATCRVDDALIEVHTDLANDARAPKRLKASEVPSAVCQTCHDTDALAEKTASSTALVDMNGTAVNPHALPDTEEHDAITCGDCHQMHATKGVDRTARATCNSCHHAGVFECGTCHAE